jgi:hypothetical protein
MHWIHTPKAEEVKRKIREKRALQLMKPRSLDSRKKMSLIMKGNKNAIGKKSDEHKRKISEAHKRIGSPWLIGKKRKPFSEEHIRKLSISKKGKNNPLWLGGISVINEGERKSWKYRNWRKKVIKKFGKFCSICGKIAIPTNVDHIKSFRFYPKLRYRVSNGRILCFPCHKKTDNYGNKELRRRIKVLI